MEMKKVILNTKKVSNHPDDAFLEIHLVYLPDKAEFATFLFNKERDSYTSGHYYTDAQVAVDDFKERT